MILPNFEYELSLLPPRCRYLLGIDEVGRGPWAGPLTLTGFLLDLKTFNPQIFVNLKVRDSKKLSHLQRQKIISKVEQQKYSTKTINIQSQELDHQGITASITSGISQILNYFQGNFDFCLIDGNYNLSPLSSKGVAGGQGILTVIKGDAKCFSIAAASIVAKEHRDSLMDQYDLQYPQYGFKNHKGYGTKQHLAALKKFGPCDIHRFSYKPIRNLSK